MSDFSRLIPDAHAFYAALDNNNRKDWWLAHKATYDTQLRAPALALIDSLTPRLADLTGLPIKGKLFRPNRDVRFSKDKTPYKTHLHMIWMAETGARQDVAFFFGIGLDYVTAGGGIMGFDKPVLDDWRLFVDQDHKRILKITDGLRRDGFRFRAPDLKRVPSGFDKDHPAAELLRMKGCVASKEIGSTQDVATDVMGVFEGLWPLNQLLIQIVEA